MDTQILNNQIKTDLEELRKDVNFGMYDFVGAMKLYLKEAKRITDKMTELRELESEEEAERIKSEEAKEDEYQAELAEKSDREALENAQRTEVI